MEERMKELGFEVEEPQEEQEQLFTAGLEAERVVRESKIASEEMIQNAEREAQRILEEAQKKADSIQIDAQKKVQALFDEQKKAGYDEGLASAQVVLEEERKQLEETLQQEQHKFQQDYESRVATMESDIIDALIQVFDKVFHIQFGDKKEILFFLIQNTLLNIESCKKFRIRVAKENLSFLEKHLSELREELGNDVQIEIVNDNGLKDADCMIETDNGLFDCSLDTELENLKKDIRSLCI